MKLRAALGLVLLALASGCAAQNEDEAAASEEAALVSVPTGAFAIDHKPYSGSYVSRLILAKGKQFEIEYVTRITTYETSVWSPWVPLPVTKEEAVVRRGKYSTFAGDPGETLMSFDITDGTGDDRTHYIFSVEGSSGTSLTLKEIGFEAFTLKKTTDAAEETDVRVLTCDAVKFTATITLDEAQRRRGTLSITPKAGASDHSDPPKGKTTVVYTGGTGVTDYMAYEGRDSKGNTYSFALRKSEMERTSGPISSVGLGFGPSEGLFGGEYHNSLTCTIARP